jgi:hypothetical protein
MPIRIVALLVICSIFMSCTHIFLINKKSQLTESPINENSEKYEAKIILKNGQDYTGSFLNFSQDSLSWKTSESETKSIRYSEIKSITFRKHGKGALEGLGMGLLLGGLFGAVIGYASGDDQDGEILSFTAKEKAILTAICCGGIGGVGGLFVGSLEGSTEKYVFKIERDSTNGINKY